MILTHTSPIKSQQKLSLDFNSSCCANFLQEIVEGLQDAILILTQTGELILQNISAVRICRQLRGGCSLENSIPCAIWHLCESLLEQNLTPEESMIISDEIVVDQSHIFRIRVRCLNLERFRSPCFLVTIENLYESLQQTAFTEVQKYELTHREAEIWCLYRVNYSYKEIADNLHISLNTVKKHMKNIHAKRQAFLHL
ncbi:helix-turn-helix transcriptional regulator [Iningainema sp. BLCCT55]|uniref:Helix-turn-helix transcriptional regulator n=2 Tax=Iningainema TaxID=1932705 RepID=A0A8J6XMQ1_9CYAN|nr:LuxR C-terminal-related transcriptional regulator [Iningainema tapete]MBD2775736.1 helix-turn-helix transcriptional regulator [Iningainema tapete BLCC-T55]